MSWKPVLVGVDGSAESVKAAMAGVAIAAAAVTECRLLHVVPDYLLAASTDLWAVPADAHRAAVENARTLMTGALGGGVPDRVLSGMEFRIGRAPHELNRAAFDCGAGLIVVGGKHHRGLERLLTGTIPHLVRTSPIPILATNGEERTVTRVLCAVDLSFAATETIAAAERFARLFGAELRVMHAIEPPPTIPGMPVTINEDDIHRSVTHSLEHAVWPRIHLGGAETVIRRGRAAAAIVSEVRDWRADLVVVGSHGKGWVDRLLIGSTSERLLRQLPTSTLIVPVTQPATSPQLAARTAANPIWEAVI